MADCHQILLARSRILLFFGLFFGFVLPLSAQHSASPIGYVTIGSSARVGPPAVLASGCFVGDGKQFVTVLGFGIGPETRDLAIHGFDGPELPASFLAQDPQTGLVLLEVPSKEAAGLTLGESKGLGIGTPLRIGGSAVRRTMLGEPRNVPAMNVGGPQMRNARLVGYEISHRGRAFPLRHLLVAQPDARTATMPGTPVLSEKGTLVGLVHGMTNQPPGTCFVLPSEAIAKVRSCYARDGMVSPAWVGLVVDTGRNTPVVLELRADSPAALCGILPGDVICAVADRSVRSVSDLVDACYYLNPDTPVDLALIRGTEPMAVSLTPGRMPTLKTKAKPSLYPVSTGGEEQ